MPDRPVELDLFLRDVEPADLPAFFEHQSDAESNRMAVVTPRDREAFDAFWARVLRDPAITVKAIVVDGAVVGNVSCFRLDGLDAVGYWIDRAHWGRGIATRALKQFLDTVTVRPLHARVAASNGASLRVLERCGFVATERRVSPATDRFPACEEVLLTLD